MNSEELELSLKTEFESYLNELFAGMRENAADLQKNFEAEFEKHRAQLDEATRLFAERFENSPKLDVAFAQSVTEHLRLAKDSGAELAAMAFSEAEKLNTETPATVSYESIRDAINEISSKTSQSTILSSLVEHAATFAPRGVFFIVKNENFVGWKRFGHDRNSPEDVANVKFEAGGETVLDRAINDLKTSDSSYSESGPDNVFVDPLELGRPDRMYAIPLVARGRGVAVMYADYGIGGTNLNIEALETLVRVAGITVELLAASQTANVPTQPVVSQPSYEPAIEAVQEVEVSEPSYVAEEAVVSEPQAETDFFVSKTFNADEMAAYVPAVTDYEIEEPASIDEYIAETTSDVSTEFEYEATSVAATELAEPEQPTYQPVEVETFAVADPAEADIEETFEVEAEFEAEEVPAETVSDFAFSSNDGSDTFTTTYAEPVEHVAETVAAEPETVTNGFHVEAVSVPVVEMPASQPQVRFSERNMDLPIEVPDDERRLHNDARRFARLLVSEIKLYNEQKVTEGRESGDLYDRLREAIDRSRDMYEKRVQPTVASKFDYFHYELVNNLAEGQEEKLGNSYAATPV